MFCRIGLDVLDEEHLKMLHLMNIESTAFSGKGVDCLYFLNPRLFAVTHGEIGSPSSDLVEQPESREVLENKIRDALFKIEGYRYTRVKKGPHTSRFICTQRSDSSRVTVSESQRKRQRRNTLMPENCGGVLTIRFAKR